MSNDFLKELCIAGAIATVLAILFFGILLTGPKTVYVMKIDDETCDGMYYNRETMSNKRHSTTRTDVECEDGRVFVNVTNLEIIGKYNIPGKLWGK